MTINDNEAGRGSGNQNGLKRDETKLFRAATRRRMLSSHADVQRGDVNGLLED